MIQTIKKYFYDLKVTSIFSKKGIKLYLILAFFLFPLSVLFDRGEKVIPQTSSFEEKKSMHIDSSSHEPSALIKIEPDSSNEKK